MILEKIVKLNLGKVRKIVQKADQKRLKKEDLVYAFSDVQGRSYYSIPTTYGASLPRYGKALDYLSWMSAGLTATELDDLIQVADDEMENLLNGKKGSLVTIGAVLQEIKLRRNMVLHTELLYNFVAVHYIREDEDPAIFNQTIQDEKIEAFKDMLAEGSNRDFFAIPELKTLSESFKMSEKEWDTLWQESLREQKEMQERIKYMRSVKPLENKGKTSGNNSSSYVKGQSKSIKPSVS